MTIKNKKVVVEKLDFSRFEFKYILPVNLSTEIISQIKHFMVLDEHLRSNSLNSYFVRSLYFDDDINTAFNDKADGLLHRSKFRIRVYDRSLSYNNSTFLEIKGRHNNLVFKHRRNIGDLAIGQLHGDSLINSIVKCEYDDEIVNKFRLQTLTQGIKPKILIDYNRAAFIGKFDPGFRITFDSNIIARESDRIFPDSTFIQPYSIVKGGVVMEVKFLHHLPSWFHSLLKEYDLRRVSISKVCDGMNRLGMASFIR